MGTYEHLSVRPDTKTLVMKNCIEEFLKYNPKFKGMHITEEFIIRRMAEHYMQCQGL